MTPRLRLTCLLLLIVSTARSASDEPFELKDGDRVAFIGNTFVEREQDYSYLETLLRPRWPDRKISFRNLGWSGDTVFGHARGYFDGAEQGFARLNTIVHDLRPTVIFISYGMGESFDGEAGLPSFRTGLERLLDTLKDLNARTVVIGPIKHENLGPPMPDPAGHNRLLRLYADAMKDVATKRGHRFVDMYELLGDGDVKSPLTENGIHLTQYGYWRAARAIAKGLGLNDPVNTNGRIMPTCPSPLEPPHDDPASRVAEKMRRLAILKNIQYFNQWRPANEPYIFGFRKAEQSRNRVEMPRFTRPIEKLEDEITKLAQPVEMKSK
jgi:lysophospholipase L1-like esterase